ncbi:FecR domain-containing protein [Rhabdobacter roseus]|uniref:Ferric-dicitrate binding protein FerR (Iron transport regulator) n=1 Tax=Rhabdobacter roseus TaxID=1655419 RepID=A0A840U2R8_9BACT|nr:FecR domain-containing protein [Rhabdobacter roseus]MBB5286139.1 ferric-dicitrate binding protein FerR (iron transport regulator) [Rhabdobacter roseus]
MKGKKPYRLEDYLSDETPVGKEQDLPPEQREMAERLRTLMQSVEDEKLASRDKEQLWERLEQSTLAAAPGAVAPDEERPARRLGWLRMAAAVALLLTSVGLGYYFLARPGSDDAMRLAAARAPTSSSTQLHLSDNRTIELDREESTIAYDGARIRLDAGTVDQVLGSEEVVYNTLVVPYGKRATLTLHDGTKVWLNSGSRLVYPAVFGGKKREVYLEGEGYFAVQHQAQQPFFVHTKSTQIEVLGTEFDVSAYDDDAQAYAVLARGSVAFTANKTALFGKIEKKITPGTKAVYDPAVGEVRLSQVPVEEYTSWKDGYLILRSAPLADILKKLARYYKLDIRLQEAALGQETFSGRLDLQDDFTSVIDIICATTSLSYHQNERRFLLEKSIPQQE